MGSWLLDQPNMGSEKSTKGLFSSSSSSSNSSSSTITTKKSKNKMSGSNSSNSSLDNNNKQIVRQPQRGLGVAQLEKIRLHTQLATPFFNPPFQQIQEGMRIQAGYQATLQSSTAFGYSSTLGSSSSYGYHPNYVMMEIKDTMERSTNIGYGESQRCPTTRWNPNIEVITPQPSMVTRHFLGNLERKYSKNDLFEYTSSSRQNSKPNDNNKNLDLELKL